MFNPIYSLISYLYYRIAGRVKLDNAQGSITIFGDREFEAFRHIQIKKSHQKAAVFLVRFSLPKSTDFEKNRKVSRRALPFFCGLPGFREKYWCVHRDSNEYLGIYEWDSFENAKKYSESFAVKFMTTRAMEGSVKFGIISNQSIEEFLNGVQQTL